MWLFCKCRRRRMTLTRLTPYRAVFPTGYHKPLHKKRQKLCWKRRENSEFSNKCLKYIKYIIKRDLNKSACCMTGVKLNLTLVIIGWFMTSLQWLNINVAVRSSKGQFPLWDAPAGDHVNSVRHFGLDICFDEYNYHRNYHDPLQARLMEGMGHRYPLFH